MNSAIADWIVAFTKLDPTLHWIAYGVAALVHVTLLLTVVMISVATFIWMERKVAARIQDRLGPTRVGGRFGWLQSPADGLKLLCKEDLIPAGADHFLFRLAPTSASPPPSASSWPSPLPAPSTATGWRCA